MRTFERTYPWISFRLNLREAGPRLWLSLGEAASKCEHIAGVPLRPATAQTLHRLFLAKGVLATTAIEGNTLTEKEVLARLDGKLAQAAASVGVEVSPIAGGAEGQQSFSETREEIEKLAKNDASIYERGGTESAAQTGEEYRQELRKALLKRGDEIRLLPWKAGSGMAKGRQRGHFFCAQIGKRVYLRFVPFERGPLISEVGTCLRLIECEEDTPRVMPDDLRQTAFAAWQRARQDIFDSWTYETDPANLQPKVPKLNRDIAEHLRKHPPTDFEQARLTRALEAVEAPCSLREQKFLRVVFEKDFPNQGAKSRALVEEVERIGLEPFHAPEPLPPICPDEVHSICWSAIDQA